jgi:hypothetical protein
MWAKKIFPLHTDECRSGQLPQTNKSLKKQVEPGKRIACCDNGIRGENPSRRMEFTFYARLLVDLFSFPK